MNSAAKWTDPNSSSFLIVDGVYAMDLWKKRKTRHLNGTCACYVAIGEGISGTRESGKDCEYSNLSGYQQKLIAKSTSG